MLGYWYKEQRKSNVLRTAKIVLAVASLGFTLNVKADKDDKKDKKVEVIHYENFNGSDRTSLLQEYHSKWINPYGPGEMAVGGVTDVKDGKLILQATPFRTSYDYSVYDHIKYLGIATQNFNIPDDGTLTFTTDIWSETPGVIPGLTMEGTFMQTGAPYRASVLVGQQAGATIHLIDFATGQLFDWFVSGNKVFCLAERLPSSITGSPIPAGRNEMYTTILKEWTVDSGMNNYGFTYHRHPGKRDSVDFLLNGEVVLSLTNIGIPPDKQGMDIITYPALGNGEILDSQIHSFSLGHGMFSLLDAFPFQHPESPELSVSIPVANRIFGQGVSAKFDNFVVKIKHSSEEDD